MPEYTEREQWFIEKIGEVIFRNETSCDCGVCKHVYDNGLIVKDKNHASYLYEMELEYAAEEVPLKYFDTKEEVIEFEKQITKP